MSVFLPPMVFSIRAEYCARILDGSKRWEFRTRCPRLERGELAYIYESRGRGRIVACFERGAIVQGSPSVVWDVVGAHRGIGRAEYDQYFAGREKAYAVGLVSVRPVEMELPKGMSAPQAWARLRGRP